MELALRGRLYWLQRLRKTLTSFFFADTGHHRLAFTRSGILIDSQAREALQLKDGVEYEHDKITYILKGIGQDRPTFSYTVRLYLRIGKAILIGK